MEYKKEPDMREQYILEDRGYTCLKLVGEGAFSKVYCLQNEKDGGIYACKVSLKIELLEREAQIMSKLRHPLFPECLEVWREEGQGFLVMEYVPGCTVEEMLSRRKCFQLEQALRMGMALADGLRVLHEGQESFVFRDIKPANIMIRQDGMVKLIDFGCGCVKGQEAASLAGTPGFAAPEQMGGESVLTEACDVYGWGQTMKAILGILDYHAILQEEGERLKSKEAEEERRKAKEAGEARQKAKEAARLNAKCTEEEGEKLKRTEGKKLEKAEKNVGRNWVNQESGHKRKMRKQLWHVLEACTRQEPSERIPDMRGIMTALMPLMSLCVENKDKRKNRKYFYFQKGIVCKKNIIMIQS